MVLAFLPSQLTVFLLTAVLGMVAGLILHFYQIVLRRAGVGKGVLFILDFILWVILLILIFSLLLIINYAEIRVYIFIALLVGTILYFRFVAKFFQGLLEFIAKSLLKIIKWLGKIFVWPIYNVRVLILRKKKAVTNDSED